MSKLKKVVACPKCYESAVREKEDAYDKGFLKGSEVGDRTAQRVRQECNADFQRLDQERIEFVKVRDNLQAEVNRLEKKVKDLEGKR